MCVCYLQSAACELWLGDYTARLLIADECVSSPSYQFSINHNLTLELNTTTQTQTQAQQQRKVSRELMLCKVERISWELAFVYLSCPTRCLFETPVNYSRNSSHQDPLFLHPASSNLNIAACLPTCQAWKEAWTEIESTWCFWQGLSFFQSCMKTNF